MYKQRMLPWAGNAPASRMEKLTFAPLDWSTHPIDTVRQPQGWGPFKGPFTPFNYRDPAMSMGADPETNPDDPCAAGINASWTQGNNATTFAPPMDILTLQVDNSTSWVNNVLKRIAGDSDPGTTRLYSSTISNARNPNPVGQTTPNTFMNRVKALLGDN